jgi:hypothetical protein
VTTRRLRKTLALLTIVLALGLGAAAPARAGDGQGEPGTTSTTSTSVTPFSGDVDQRIIPRPNSGHPPQDAGDRGGALQFALLGLIVLGVTIVCVKIFRSTRQIQA